MSVNKLSGHSLQIQDSPFIMHLNWIFFKPKLDMLSICLGSIGLDCVISVPCYKGTILQRNSL